MDGGKDLAEAGSFLLWQARGVAVRSMAVRSVAVRTALRAVGWGCAGRHTLGGLGQHCGELIANCD